VAGLPLFSKFVYGPPEEIAEALDKAVTAMQKRADRLRGTTRKLVPSVDEPLFVIVVDEIASLTAYVQEAAMRRRIGNALSMLLSQGRAVGYTVIAATQDARKETLGMRDLFPSRVALRTAEANQVDLILGQGARERGARSDAISEHMPGVGYAVVDDMPEPVRVRFAHVTDARIERATAVTSVET
jgi:S-DNA-T family DNA segregation ATPase FtsK/SpoIIIE